jgi:hypothetical protein
MAPRAAVKSVVIGLDSDGKLEVKARYDPALKAAIKGLGDRRTRDWDSDRKAWVVARARLLDLMKALYEVLPPDAEIKLDSDLYVFSDCPKGHTTRDLLEKCPECGAAIDRHRAGKFVKSETVECIARCFDAVNDECNCVCLGKCHGLRYCSGPHKASDWQQAGVSV